MSNLSNCSKHILDAADYFQPIIDASSGRSHESDLCPITQNVKCLQRLVVFKFSSPLWLGVGDIIQERFPCEAHSISAIAVYCTRWSGRCNKDGMGLLSPRQDTGNNCMIGKILVASAERPPLLVSQSAPQNPFGGKEDIGQKCSLRSRNL